MYNGAETAWSVVSVCLITDWLVETPRHQCLGRWLDSMSKCWESSSCPKSSPSNSGEIQVLFQYKLFIRPIGHYETINTSRIGSYQQPKHPWSWPFLVIFHLKKVGSWTDVRVSDDRPLKYLFSCLQTLWEELVFNSSLSCELFWGLLSLERISMWLQLPLLHQRSGNLIWDSTDLQSWG